MFARAAAVVQNKKNLVQEAAQCKSSSSSSSPPPSSLLIQSQLLEIVRGDESMVEQIVAAAKNSMGMDCSDIDMMNIVNFTSRMVKLAKYRKQLSLYLTDKMSIIAPNLSALIGDTIAVRLISKVHVFLPLTFASCCCCSCCCTCWSLSKRCVFRVDWFVVVAWDTLLTKHTRFSSLNSCLLFCSC